MEAGNGETKRDQAAKIIHTAASAVAASTSLLPFGAFGTDMIVANSINAGMIVALAKLFDQELDKTAAATLVSTISSSAIGVTGARSLLSWFPGIGTLVRPAITFAYIEAIGWKAYKHFEAQECVGGEAQVTESSLNTERNRAFICYCHDDSKYVNEFRKHLRCYEIEGLIDVFCDKNIGAGADWRQAIAEALEHTRVAVCFLSPGFLLSDFIRKVELPALLDGAEKEGVLCLTLMVSPTPKTETMDRLLRYQSPVALEPIRRMRPIDREETYKIIAEAVVGILKPNVLIEPPIKNF